MYKYLCLQDGVGTTFDTKSLASMKSSIRLREVNDNDDLIDLLDRKSVINNTATENLLKKNRLVNQKFS